MLNKSIHYWEMPGDALETYLRHSLPAELQDALADRLAELNQGEFEKILGHSWTKDVLLSDGIVETEGLTQNWTSLIGNRLDEFLRGKQDEERLLYQYHFLLVAIAALQSFLQSNVTGPPLPFNPENALFPRTVASSRHILSKLRHQLVLSLGADGEAAYKLTPNVELVCLAKLILSSPAGTEGIKSVAWAKLRTDFMQQRLLSEIAPTLQKTIYEGLDRVENILAELKGTELYLELYPQFLLEVAAIHTHHGLDKLARQTLDEAAKERKFEFAITGLLGKRTKFQTRDISQLVVLAKSATGEQDGTATASRAGDKSITKPENLDLNDDTLLEAISFSERPNDKTSTILDAASLPPALAALDPGAQPLLHPLDSIILLSVASSITNTSPGDGLTREETGPYAVRVLDGGSSNWQVYTQALLVRSRVEGYRSRTIERGLLQLQAVVDQVVAETTSADNSTPSITINNTSTFLPRAKESESASITERLQYIYPLCSPTRWELEAELASRWVSLGGLRSALEIYERLEMWAEAALCWAATDREDKARKIVRRQLYHATQGADEHADLDEEKWEGPERDLAPADAPRLYCILGDMDNDASWWEKAWDVSGHRYARAQRTLGRHYIKAGDYVKAAAAYSASLKINQLNQQSWFALGCCLLELAEFPRAVEAFSRTVQLDDTDAEAWSNLAAALLKKEHTEPSASQPIFNNEEHDNNNNVKVDPQQNIRDALQSLKRAATLKHDSARIWDNLLTVSATLEPPSFADIVVAQKRLIDLRGKSEGEKCIDISILALLVRHVTASGPSDMGLPRLVLELFDSGIIPLITTDKRLWDLVAVLAVWRGAPGQALEASEKGWRAVLAQPGWEMGEPEAWEKVVQATTDLVEAYESFGPRTREGEGGEKALVAKDWKFKARSAVRGIMGRGKDGWEGTDGWQKLVDVLEELKGSA